VHRTEVGGGGVVVHRTEIEGGVHRTEVDGHKSKELAKCDVCLVNGPGRILKVDNL